MDNEMDGFEQCEACDGYFDRHDLGVDGLCEDCAAELDDLGM